MRIRVGLLQAFSLFVLAFAASGAHAQEREEARLMTATQVLEELGASRDQFIPDKLLERAYGIAVVPNVTKVAFFAGGRRGKGVLVVRDKNGRFTSPIFINLTGGSFGWQWGVQSTDFVLVFTTRAGIEGITDGKLTLGADASVAAGPVGRQASAATDASFSAEVYSYSRSSGLFAGVALDGTAMTIDDRSNGRYYRKSGTTASDIISGSVSSDAATVHRFLAAVAASTGTNGRAASATPPAAATAPAADGAPQAAPAPASDVQTFPMEDPRPGQEPAQ